MHSGVNKEAGRTRISGMGFSHKNSRGSGGKYNMNVDLLAA
jgi:hypothetical protein